MKTHTFFLYLSMLSFLMLGLWIGTMACSSPSKADDVRQLADKNLEIAKSIEKRLDDIAGKAKSGRHLGEEFALEYMTKRFRLLDKPECVRWEDNGPNQVQSVLCAVADQVAVYCAGGGGKAPFCEFVVDKRPKPPEAPKPPEKPAPPTK